MPNLRTAAHGKLAAHCLVAFGAEQLLTQSRFKKESLLLLKIRLNGKIAFRRMLPSSGLT